ncbi:50S ribosomal protein L25/general stress protein Ctc [Acidisoma cellulosilytica]|uniref:Large ribosomal subunit protein bL25 n=1 Tax=Acidisoma cellulosilyticum TaxID=2802395 RepID=A0A963YYI0_9PROT|nr:50S ribosomal protein L25/general stress protein Ctc [Acidisoma cellulosilyticum]MCB8879191.1 50S ribosomal protein L25/general stress protein Ctc [Acidisoma cellulosilyticum]
MANFTSISAELRERAGKGAARATRRAGKVPAVIYGAKQTPTLISLEPRAVIKELHRGGWRSRLYELDLGADKARALIRDVQFHPVTDQPEHVDFQRLAPGELIRVAVAVSFEGEAVSPGLKRGGVLNVVRHTVEVYADPETVPEHFVADLSTLDINDNVRFSDLKGTEGTRATILDRDFVIASVASVTQNAADAAEEAAAAAASAAAAAAKGGKSGGKPAAKPAAAAPAKKK